MAANMCQQVCSETKQCTLQASIRLDESTDSALESHLIAFARYEKDEKIKEEFLFSNTLSATTTAANFKATLLSNTTLRQLFMKYNAAMTSNAAVKHLFLLEKDHLKLKRSGLSDHWGI